MFEDKNRIQKTLVTFRLFSPIDLGFTLSRQAEPQWNITVYKRA